MLCVCGGGRVCFACECVRWYAVVGSYLTLTVLVDVATPILFTLIKVSWSQIRRRRWFTQWKLTQDDLDNLFIGPRFNLATRISSVLSTAFVAMMFCGGLPLLVPIAACGFTAQYWVRCRICDKFLCLFVVWDTVT
jgi:hypothetical protein